jgi:hypothetical protein
MAKEYKVKGLTLGGPGNKIYKKGTVVTQKNFPDSKMEDLVKNGSLTETEVPDVDTKPTSILETITTDLFPDGESVKSIDGFSIKQLKRELSNAEVEVPQDASKEQLYELWLKIKK